MSTLVSPNSIDPIIRLTTADQGSLLRPIHLFRTGPNRPWPQQGWHDHRTHILDRSRSAWTGMAMRESPTCAGVLSIFRSRHHNGLVHATHLLPYGLCPNCPLSRGAHLTGTGIVHRCPAPGISRCAEIRWIQPRCHSRPWRRFGSRYEGDTREDGLATSLPRQTHEKW